jgi:hypothetical protein
MRAQYFKHRHWADFSQDTNDIGRPLFWPKDNEDNHFIQITFESTPMSQGIPSIGRSFL